MNPHFIHHAEFEQQPDGRNFKLVAPFAFVSASNGWIAVPRGFVTDLASVPKLFWNILPPFGKYTDAAVLHDFLYRTQVFARKKCDGLLREAMVASRVPWWQRQLIYWNVRWFGWLPWRDEKRRVKLTSYSYPKTLEEISEIKNHERKTA